MKSPVTFRFDGGVNSEVYPEDFSGLIDSKNFLFEKGGALRLPQVSDYAVGGADPGARIIYAFKADPPGNNSAFLTANQKMYVGSFAYTEITGPGLPAIIASNDAFMFVGCDEALMTTFGVYGDPARKAQGAVVYTIPTMPVLTASPTTGCSFKGRSFLGGNHFNPYVAYSAVGNSNDWTGGTAGVITLADFAGNLYGMYPQYDRVLLMFGDGLAYMYATGSSLLPIKIEALARDSYGMRHYNAGVLFNGVLYYVGWDNIFSTSPSGIKPIGGPIRNEFIDQFDLNPASNVRVQLSSYFNKSSRRPRVWFFFVPQLLSIPSDLNTVFCYDVEEEKWSKHDFSSVSSFSFMLAQPDLTNGILLYPFSSSKNVKLLSESTQRTPNLPNQLITSSISPSEDVTDVINVSRGHLKYKDNGIATLRVVVRGRSGTRVIEKESIIRVGAEPATGEWLVSSFPVGIASATFNARIEVISGDPELRSLQLDVSKGGRL